MSTTTASWQICPNCDGNLTPGHTCPSKTTDELFAAAYVEYRDMVRRVILADLNDGDKDLAEDLMQETFLRIYRQRDHIEFGPRIGALLRLAGRRSVLNHYVVKRNKYERATDMADSSIANSNLTPAASGAYEVVRTGSRTVRIGASV